MKKIAIILFFILLIIIGAIFYFRLQVYYSHGSHDGEKVFEIVKGEGNGDVSQNLEREGLVSGNWYFYFYIRSQGLLNKIMPGEYQLSGKMTIPEIAHIVTDQEQKFLKVTFPEGWTANLMAERLNANGLAGDRFLEIVKNPGDFKKRYSYLSDAATLEGYLFPDTYFFKPDITVENIVGRMLDTFDQKLDEDLRSAVFARSRSMKEIITMASIIEREVQTAEDMKIVSGIFWKRIADGTRLQSDAPLSYILNDKKDRHNEAELGTDSPYNTYRNAGLPPGPIGNPGMKAILASIYPQDSNYYFFLTTTVDDVKEVVYSENFEEHVANRQKYGL
jgi:UPF0755 protein